MKSIKKKIVITGGQGRFAQTLKHYTKLNIYYPNKKELNILSYKSIENYIKKIKPKYILHAAALSRPMNIHDKNMAGVIIYKYNFLSIILNISETLDSSLFSA